MRRFPLIALAAVTALPLAACSGAHSEGASASGIGSTRTFAVDGFNAVEATGPDDVDIRVGPAFSIRAQGDPKVLDKLVIEKKGDTLEVRRKDQSGFSWDNGDRGAKVTITLPRLTAVASTGSGDINVDRVEGDGFKASATGSGNMMLGTVKVQTLDVSITGSGNVAAAGTAKSATLSITGSGDIDANKLSLSSADVSVTGSGNVEAVVAGPAKVDVMGSGDVTLTGGAKCTTSKMGPGEVTCS